MVVSALPAHADGGRLDRTGFWRDRYDDYQNRRDARRAGLAAAIVVSGISRAVQQDQIAQRYSECMRNGRYDLYCDRQRFWEQQEARKRAKRRALMTGVIVRGIVRD